MSETFSLHPTTQAELDELEERGIEWIKDKLQESRNHIIQLRAVMDLADQQDLSEPDAYALLAYRLLIDMLSITQQDVRQVQEPLPPTRILSQTGEILT